MKRKHKKTLRILTLIAAFAQTGHSAITFIYVDAQASSGSISGQASDVNISGVEFSRGPDLVPDATFPGYFDSENWSTSLTFPGTGSGSYVAFQFEVAAGYVFDPASLSFYYEEGGNERGPVIVDLRSNSDNYANSLHLDTDAWDGAVETVSELNLSPVTGVVEFRFYGYAALNSSGLLGFTNNEAIDYEGSGVSLLMQGDLQPIPEVGHSAMLCGLGAVLLVWARRRRVA